MPAHVGELTTNMRQLCNQLTSHGTGILDLASLYVRWDLAEVKVADIEADEEEMLRKVQEGGDLDTRKPEKIDVFTNLRSG